MDARQIVAQLLEDEVKDELLAAAVPRCRECGADLTKPGSVHSVVYSRSRPQKSYDQFGHIDPETDRYVVDEELSRSIYGVDLLELESDSCVKCGNQINWGEDTWHGH